MDRADPCASIYFLPVCSKCHHIIMDSIDCKPRVEEITRSKEHMKMVEYDVYPSWCEHCGAPFINIIMPTRLPFQSAELLGE